MPTTVSRPKLEYRGDSGVVATPTPRISWKTTTDSSNWAQESAEIELNIDGAAHRSLQPGDASVFVAWPFAPLRPRQRGSLRVRVTGSDRATSEWSEPVEVLAGFLAEGEWAAQFITMPELSEAGQPFLLRREFELRGPVASAMLYATARGVYQAQLNGQEVDDQVLKPGWTSYQFRLIHESTDVTALVTEGANVIGASVAGGWYTENFGFQGLAKPFYGTYPSFAAQLHVTYEDGTSEVIATDETWRASPDGPIRSSGIYAGEAYDARRRLDDAHWFDAVVDASPGPVPIARSSPIVRRTQEVRVQSVLASPSGRTILDFGQNLVGWLRIEVSGRAGDTVVLRHAEVLEHGELGVRPLRVAKATDSYTLAGGGPETWEPAFTFHGFRYAEIQGWPGEFDPASVTAIVVHSDMERTGWFESSHELVNQLHSNVVWGMRGNFLYLPTDCPQSDERLGWTGDIQVFSPTASFLYDCDGFLASWLEDLALEQRAAGSVPFIVPDVLAWKENPTAAWGDAATVVPSVLHERFADRRVLEVQFESMKAWVEEILRIAGDRHLWEGQFQFGDWLDPDSPADRPADAKTDGDIVASAYLFHSARLVSSSAEVLGKIEDSEFYAAAAERVRAAWVAEYTTPAGRIVSDAQTAYALALVFEIVTEPALVERMGRRLAWLVRRDGFRIGTGFVGTPLVQDALSRTGHLGTASRLLLQTEAPSWLYPVTMGATTVWERWDSMLEDGSINPGEMTSFNHYAFGAIADWLHRVVAGLAPAEPGYKKIRLAPQPIPGLTRASASHETPYGPSKIEWTIADGTMTVLATVPPNSRATVTLPGAAAFEVGSGDFEWSLPWVEAVPARPPVSPDSSLAALIEDPEAYRAVWQSMAAVDPATATEFRKHTKWVDERSLAGTFALIPPAVIEQVERALEELNRERAGA